MSKRKQVTMLVTVSVNAWMTAAQARREVRYSINEGVGYMSTGPNYEEVVVRVRGIKPAKAVRDV